MGNHHILSISEEQLRAWSKSSESWTRNIGEAVVLASLSSPTFTVSVNADERGQLGGKESPRLTIHPLGTYEASEGAPIPDVSAWKVEGSKQAMDVLTEQLPLLLKLTLAMRMDQQGSSVESYVAAKDGPTLPGESQQKTEGMTWNHRVMATADKFVIREVYFRADGTVQGWTAGPAIPSAETIDGLRWVIDRYQEALEKPVIEIADEKMGRAG